MSDRNNYYKQEVLVMWQYAVAHCGVPETPLWLTLGGGGEVSTLDSSQRFPI